MECCLEKGELLRLEGGNHGLSLGCSNGTVWLTLGDGADYLVQAGKRFEIPARQVAVVEALKSSEFCLGETVTAKDMLHKSLIGFAAC